MSLEKLERMMFQNLRKNKKSSSQAAASESSAKCKLKSAKMDEPFYLPDQNRISKFKLLLLVDVRT